MQVAQRDLIVNLTHNDVPACQNMNRLPRILVARMNSRALGQCRPKVARNMTQTRIRFNVRIENGQRNLRVLSLSLGNSVSQVRFEAVH